MTMQRIARLLAPAGLIPRGGFHPRPDDGVPPLPDQRPVATLVLVGNAGPAMWRAFRTERPGAAGANPLDEWTRDTLGRIAAELGCHPLFPFGGRPWLPFQRWAQRAEAVHPSPIGPLIHPDYGLWHAYRGAFAFAERLALPPPDERPSPCESCADKPCLATCPVEALAPGAYDVPRCVEHIAGEDGRDCRELGCRARRACPVGTGFVYQPEHAAFHMAAFIRANRRRSDAVR